MQTPTGRTAAESPSVFIVEASAGSGKTYALSKRYVSLLLDPRRHPQDVPLRSLLAITFTNKAAFEMKGRILELLRRIALDIFERPGEKQDIIASLGGDAPRIRRKALATMDHLVRNYNFFRVQTIDSFINALLAGCAFKLDLSSKFRIKNDYFEYLRYSLDQLIDRVRVDSQLAGLFREFLHQYLFLEQRTSWFPKYDIMRILDTLVCSLNTYGGRFWKEPGRAQDILKERRRLRGLLQKLAAKLPGSTDRRFRDSLERILSENKSSVSVDGLSLFFDRADFPVTADTRPPQAVKLLWSSIRRQCQVLVELEAIAVFNCYIGLFDRFFVEFSRAARRDDVVFLAELNRTARLLFDEGFVTVPELYIRLSCRFDTYLIDEFQDTSFLQWKNIVPLIEDGLARGGSLFYVGDKKQAIYRFRGGEVHLFDQVQEEFARFKPEIDVLRTNYRSRREIVAFNNMLFGQENIRRALTQLQQRNQGSAVSLHDDDVADIAGYYAETAQTARPDKPGGFVNVASIAGKDEDERSDAVRARLVAAIADLSTRFPYRDIAVLARSNDHVELCAGWLMHAGIPVQSDKTINIRQHPLIKELISFLRFLSSPIDNLSFSSFILGRIFVQASGLSKDEINAFLFDAAPCDRSHPSAAYYRIFRARYPGLWERLFDEFFSSVGFIPLYELVIGILARFEALDRFAGYQGFFMRLLELISVKEQEFPTVSSFLRYFDEAPDDDLYVDVGQTNAVNVLTIHKAKGLEFRAVIVPFVHFAVQPGGVTVYPHENRLTIVRLTKAYSRFSERLASLYRLEYKRSLIDELNTLYVAFTRARDELFVFVPEKSGNAASDARLLFTGLDCTWGSAVSEQKLLTQPQGDILLIKPAHYRDWIPLLRDEFPGALPQPLKRKVREGELIHAIFAGIRSVTRASLDAQIRRAVRNAGARFTREQDLGGYESKIRRMIIRPSWRAFFFVRDEVFAEQEFVTSGGRTRRIDRLIIGPHEVLAVDFKSSAQRNAEDDIQLREYMRILKDVFPEKSSKGFFLYFDRARVDQIDA